MNGINVMNRAERKHCDIFRTTSAESLVMNAGDRVMNQQEVLKGMKTAVVPF